MKQIIRESILWISLILVSIIVGGTIYQMLVIVPEFNRDIPNAMIGFARGHISTKSFWGAPFQDLCLLFLIASTIFNWKNGRRYWILGTTILAVLSIVLTIIIAVPQLQIMGILDGKPSNDIELLTKTIKTFTMFDQLRFWTLIFPAYLLLIRAITIKVN